MIPDSIPVSSETQPASHLSFKHLDIDLKRATAMGYARRLNMAAFPVYDKKPPPGVAWSAWTANAGVYDKVDAHWAAATGFALSPAHDSLMAVIDLDEPTFLPELLAAAPHLEKTFQVRRGDHIHFYIKLARPLVYKAYQSLAVIKKLNLVVIHEACHGG